MEHAMLRWFIVTGLVGLLTTLGVALGIEAWFRDCEAMFYDARVSIKRPGVPERFIDPRIDVWASSFEEHWFAVQRMSAPGRAEFTVVCVQDEAGAAYQADDLAYSSGDGPSQGVRACPSWVGRWAADHPLVNGEIPYRYPTCFGGPAIGESGYLNAVGWPRLCLARTSVGGKTMVSDRLVLPEGLGSFSSMQIPSRVIWSGLGINTLFWGAVVVTPIGVVRTVRSRRRRRAGCCLACGYDVSGLDRCPECGTLVASAC
jgi:hypothetical protein